MRALASRIHRELAATPRPSLALKSLGSSFPHRHRYDSPPKKGKNSSYILGLNLPNIWNWSPPNSTPPSPPPSQTPGNGSFFPVPSLAMTGCGIKSDVSSSCSLGEVFDGT